MDGFLSSAWNGVFGGNEPHQQVTNDVHGNSMGNNIHGMLGGSDIHGNSQYNNVHGNSGLSDVLGNHTIEPG